MGELIQLELKKLCRRKLTVIVTFVCFLATVLFFTLPFIQYVTWDENGVMLRGGKAVEYRKHAFGNLEGILDEERITEDLREYQKLYSDPDNLIIERGGDVSFKDEIYYSYLSGRTSYMNMLGNTYNYNGLGYLNISAIDLEHGAKFYETREHTVNMLIDNNKDLNEEEKNYWKDKNAKVEEPYEYGYPLGWSMFGDTVQMFIVCILGICICTAPVFCGEYQTGTDAVILSSRYGKSKVIPAKIIASIVFGTVVFIVNVIAALSITLLTFGSEGADMALQIMDSTCPYNLTFGQATVIMICTVYFVMLGMLSVTLLCSAKMQSTFQVLIADIVLIFLPVFVGKGMNPLWTHIWYILPYNAAAGLSQFKEYVSYSFGHIVINLVSMASFVNVAVLVGAVPMSGILFRRHQVK